MFPRPLPLVRAMLAAGLLSATGTAFAQLTAAGSGGNTILLSLSGDGAVAGGSSQSVTTQSQGLIWTLAGQTGDPTPNSLQVSGYSFHEIRGLSDSGAVAAGTAYRWNNAGDYLSQAFKWTRGSGNGTLSELAPLSSGKNSAAEAVSGDGNVLVGSAVNAGGVTRAVRWDATGAIHDLGGGSFTDTSRALGVSSDGGAIVGYGAVGSGYRAFRWTSGGGMADLGVIAGKANSEAHAVSDNGLVVVGNSSNGYSDLRAFRWENGAMQDLGTIGAATRSQAKGVSADGAVVVGHVDSETEASRVAFRWTQADGMQSIATWLAAGSIDVSDASFYTAERVSNAGDTVVGYGRINGGNQYYVARRSGSSGGTGSTGGTGGVVGLRDFHATVMDIVRSFSAGLKFAGLTLFGAHHRVLADNGLGGGNCFWATGDLGSGRAGDTRQQLGEVGLCHESGDWVVGAGLGASRVRSEQTLGGLSRFGGQHLFLEADYRLGGGLIASLTGFFGRWNGELRRHYLNGAAIDASSGSTTVSSWASRMRLDWLDAVQLGLAGLSPFIAYTDGRSRLDGYSENGGGFPVRFDTVLAKSREWRLGATAKMALAETSDLRLSAEAIERRENSQVTGLMIGVGTFATQAAAAPARQTRLGAEVDRRFGRDTVLNASLHVVPSGAERGWLGSVSWRKMF